MRDRRYDRGDSRCTGGGEGEGPSRAKCGCGFSLFYVHISQCAQKLYNCKKQNQKLKLALVTRNTAARNPTSTAHVCVMATKIKGLFYLFFMREKNKNKLPSFFYLFCLLSLKIKQ